jgi:hypothetical protein
MVYQCDLDNDVPPNYEGPLHHYESNNVEYNMHHQEYERMQHECRITTHQLQ